MIMYYYLNFRLKTKTGSKISQKREKRYKDKTLCYTYWNRTSHYLFIVLCLHRREEKKDQMDQDKEIKKKVDFNCATS